MSVLIKGIEMPGKCDSCNVNKCFLWYDYDDSSCRRHPDCPLVEVPEPHGRLIDADKQLDRLDHCMFPSDMATTIAVGMHREWIKNAPTVIPASEVET